MSAILFILVLLCLGAGYIFYGGYITKVFGINKDRKTPAHSKHDGVDYVPAKNWLVIFGHHFASIAGAGPIIGTVLAYLWWGWLGALIWIVLGTIFMGAVHDFASVFISVRENGASIGQIAQKYVSKRASIFFLAFLWFSLIIVIAVFAAICAKSFISQPKVVVSSLGLIPVAVFLGILIYRIKLNIFLSTAIGILFLVFLIMLGERFPLTLPGANAYTTWIVVLLIYAFFASVIPVNMLLQPRDYLSSFLLFFGIGAAAFGILSRPLPIGGAKLFSFNSPGGLMFPVMFITIACGAISGFHSLVASGTTSKQISSERDIKRIGYGSMVLEAVLAVIVLFSVAFGLKNIPQGVSEPAEIFSLGFSSVSYFLGDQGSFIALVILNAFILTTLDTATRITRFLTHEMFGLNNKWLATGVVILFAGYLALLDKWQLLWPIFGASNQLVAGGALVVASSWLLAKGKNYKITFIPAVIMIFLSIFALGFKMWEFFSKGNYILTGISALLIILGVLGVYEFKRLIKCRIN
ncbi:MAG: carbon starvation protein A [Candidatus Omnitrophica bacterium]|nr:carbon starvation protein A [Candidatus Omnitrophota bacterium]MDD5430031.1 carbon starvation protein A [Candidatus Omnitrophota bacterium]